jgi:hypothetical protein
MQQARVHQREMMPTKETTGTKACAQTEVHVVITPLLAAGSGVGVVLAELLAEAVAVVLTVTPVALTDANAGTVLAASVKALLTRAVSSVVVFALKFWATVAFDAEAGTVMVYATESAPANRRASFNRREDAADTVTATCAAVMALPAAEAISTASELSNAFFAAALPRTAEGSGMDISKTPLTVASIAAPVEFAAGFALPVEFAAGFAASNPQLFDSVSHMSSAEQFALVAPSFSQEVLWVDDL